MTVPLGIRNNNPGNLRVSKIKWWGESFSVDSEGFCVFVTPEAGIRALCKNLLAYEDHDGLDDISEYISRWAPPDENDTPAYIQAVTTELGVSASQVYDLHNEQNLIMLAKAITLHEQGENLYTDDQFLTGANYALGV